MTLKSEVAELCYEVADLSSGELRLTFTSGTALVKVGLVVVWLLQWRNQKFAIEGVLRF